MHRRTILAIGMTLAPAAGILGQCEPTWLSAGDSPLTRPGAVQASTPWDPDGPGPGVERIVLGGEFTLAGDPILPTTGVVSWDGTQWSTFGPGPVHTARSVFVWNGDLLAGGLNTVAPFPNGGPAVSRWDADLEAWIPVGGPFKAVTAPPSVDALGSFNGSLFVGGTFSSVGTFSTNHIARWAGSQWEPVGGGLQGSSDVVSDLQEFDGALFVAGAFTNAGGVSTSNVARWTGVQWTSPAGGLTGPRVRVLAVHQNSLIAAGNIFAPSANIAQWNGNEWSALGNGLGMVSGVDGVYALASAGDSLFAAGRFTAAGLTPANSIARWDGVDWHPLAQGLELPEDGATPIAQTLFFLNGKLGAAGSFSLAGAMPTNAVALWDGAVWTGAPGGCRSGQVNALATYLGDTYAGGWFTRAGMATASYIARRTAGQGDWVPLATPGAGTNGAVWAAQPFAGKLIVGGDFTIAGGVSANRIAAWDGSQWTPLGTGMANNPTPPRVAALSLYDGFLIAAGRFSHAGNFSATNIARWDGTTWSSMSGGLGNPLLNSVAALVPYKGQLYAGTNILSAPLQRFNGSSWQVVPLSPTTPVHALLVFGDDLIVGGFFQTAGGQVANSIARFNGTTWSVLGSAPDVGVVGTVKSLSSWNGQLLVGGTFSKAGPLAASNLALWDGSEWSNIGTQSLPGANGAVLAMSTTYGKPPLVAGAFSVVGDSIAPITAEFACTCPADCQADGVLNIDDFVCFQTLYALGDPYSDCDGNGNLNIVDFICFQTNYAVGC